MKTASSSTIVNHRNANSSQGHTALKAGTKAILSSHTNKGSNQVKDLLQNSSCSKSINSKSSQYKPLKIIGQGAFGVVCIAKRISDGKYVAIKKVLQDPSYKNRELEILQSIDNINCISLLSFYKTKGRNIANRKNSNNSNSSSRKESQSEIYLNLVMEYLPMNLNEFVLTFRNDHKYPPLFYIKLFSYQLFSGLFYLHSNGISHRDLKPQNILIDPDTCRLKICDFGSAKRLLYGERSVSYIASRYYRAPELIYDCEYYTNSIDIWSAGCVIAEMLCAGTPIFPGNSSIGQLYEIVRVIGYPSEDDLQSFRHNKKNLNLPSEMGLTTPIESILPDFTPIELVELLKRIFVFAPSKRPSAEECLRAPFFDGIAEMPNLPSGKPLPELLRL